MIDASITAYDRNWRPHRITVENYRGCYRVFVDGVFYSSHDSRREADDEIDDILTCGKYITHDMD